MDGTEFVILATERVKANGKPLCFDNIWSTMWTYWPECRSLDRAELQAAVTEAVAPDAIVSELLKD